MTVRHSLHIGMSLSPTWLSGDAWRLADSNVEGIYGSEFYLAVAKRAEAAKLDFVFRADTLFIDETVLDRGPGFSGIDPMILLAALARETSRIGLIATVSTSFNEPYQVARQLMSLHWLSQGRVGWNIVTALAGQKNFGLEAMPSAEQRYARAAEFTEVVKKLWQSFPHAALKIDRHSGVFADPELVKPISHLGPLFKVAGPLTVPDYKGVDIPLIQAGASDTGRNFAAGIADAIFASTPDIIAAKELRQDLRRRATSQGRHGDDIRLLPGLNLYLAETKAQAKELFAASHARVDRQQRLASVSRLIGLDLTAWPDDRQVTLADIPKPSEPPRSRTHYELMLRLIDRDKPTVAELLNRPEVIASAHWLIVGTVDDAAKEIAKWRDAAAIDGFIAVPGGSFNSVKLTLDELIPRLAEKGLFRKEYSGSTFVEHLRF